MYFYGPMNGYDWGLGIFMGILWLLFIIFTVNVFVRWIGHFEGHNAVNDQRKRIDPIDIVKDRYAKGEITKEQFDQLKKDLK
jgi:putative membrane protein